MAVLRTATFTGSAAERVFFADDGPRVVGAQVRERARRARIADTAVCMVAAVGYSEQLWC